MGRVFHPYYKCRRTGERVYVTAWYAEWTGADGKTHRKKVGRNKSLADRFLAARLDEVERQKAGFGPAPSRAAADRPIHLLLDDYVRVLADRGRDPVYRANVEARVRWVLGAAGWLMLADVEPDGMQGVLGRLRGPEFDLAAATCNGYLRDVKGFTKWAAKKLKLANPLGDVKPLDESDRRRSRAILTDAELARVVAAAERARDHHHAVISGRDRAWLYRVAAYSGHRASELASLTPDRFDLAAAVPTVTVEAKYAKGRREEPIPLPAHLVPALKRWLRGRPAGERLWPGAWVDSKRSSRWFARDKAAAGVVSTATFHGLRRGYLTRLARSGIDPKLLQRLARHRDLKTTLNYYVNADLPDLAAAADRLKPLPRTRKPKAG
jgi:integrase